MEPLFDKNVAQAHVQPGGAEMPKTVQPGHGCNGPMVHGRAVKGLDHGPLGLIERSSAILRADLKGHKVAGYQGGMVCSRIGGMAMGRQFGCQAQWHSGWHRRVAARSVG